MIRSIKLSLGEPVPVSSIPMWTLISEGLLCLIWPRARNSSFSALGFWYLREEETKDDNTSQVEVKYTKIWKETSLRAMTTHKPETEFDR